LPESEQRFSADTEREDKFMEWIREVQGKKLEQNIRKKKQIFFKEAVNV
jgi:hypothetical protein